MPICNQCNEELFQKEFELKARGLYRKTCKSCRGYQRKLKERYSRDKITRANLAYKKQQDVLEAVTKSDLRSSKFRPIDLDQSYPTFG